VTADATRRRLAIGLDIGGTKVLGVAVDQESGRLLAEHKVPTVPREDRVVETLGAVADRLVDEVTTADGRAPVVSAAGLGAPGLVDRSGTLRYGANLPGVVDAPLGRRLAERLGVAVAVDNDATCAAWGEHELGAARGHNHSITITLGTGIGAGITARGRVLRGANGFAGEPGHMLVDPAGPPCPCGRRGCWERYGSGSGLGRLGREAVAAGRGARILQLAGGDVEQVVGEHVSAAAAEGDADALAVLDRFGWWVAAGSANLVDLLDTEIVVLGGGLVDIGELLLDPVRRHFAAQLYGVGRRPEVPIVAAQLGSRAGAIGAALLGLERREGP